MLSTLVMPRTPKLSRNDEKPVPVPNIDAIRLPKPSTSIPATVHIATNQQLVQEWHSVTYSGQDSVTHSFRTWATDNSTRLAAVNRSRISIHGRAGRNYPHT